MREQIQTKTDFTAKPSGPPFWPIALGFSILIYAGLSEIDVLWRLDQLAMWISQLSLKLSLLILNIFSLLLQALLVFVIVKLVYAEFKKRYRGGS